MKILMAFHAAPYPPDIGPARRHYHVLVETMKRHDAWVLSFGSETDRAAVLRHTGLEPRRVSFVANASGRGRKMARSAYYLCTGRSDFRRLYRAAFQQRLDEITWEQPFDAVYFSTVMLGCYDLPRGVPLVGDTHNVEHDNLARAAAQAPERWRRGFFRAQAALTRREECAYARKFSLVCATSPRDQRLFERLAPSTPVVVVPNGIDREKYRPLRSEPTPGTILFSGLMSYYPNEHAAIRFATRILPLVRARVPGARLLIVGADPSPAVRGLAGDAVRVTGRVRDVRPYYGMSEVSVVPLAIGGGTRVKVLESLSMGVPVVSTAVGCEGLDVAHGRSVLLADSDEAFAEEVAKVLTNRTLRATLVDEGRAVAERYDWRHVGRALDRALHAAVASSPIDLVRGAPCAG